MRITRAGAVTVVVGLLLAAFSAAAQPSQPSPHVRQETALTLSNVAASTTLETVARQVQTSTSVSTTSPQKSELVINAVGDVNVDPGYIPIFVESGYGHALSGMDGLFIEDDLTIINLECPASDLEGIKDDKLFNFRCSVDALPALRELGVDVASQANNHALDYGVDVLLDSMRNLEDADIVPIGAGPTSTKANEAALFEIDGWTVAVLGFGGVVPTSDWIATETRPGVSDGYSIESMVSAVKAADKKADIVVVTIHWGAELQPGPAADDVARGEAMIDAGADMIFGHHPHRLNSLDTYKGKPIAWSLGNFVWPRLSIQGSDTAVAQVVINPDGTITSCLLDVTIVSDGHPELDDPTRRSC